MWLTQLIKAVKTLVKTADSTERDMLDDKTEEKVNKNLYWQERLGWGLCDICKALGTTRLSTVESASFVKRVTNWQRARGLVSDGIVGPKTWRIMSDSLLTPKQQAVRRVMEPTIGKESGGRYGAMNKDGEFRGHFKDHRAEGEIHIGLSFGVLQFTQDGGSLGELLKRCAKENPEKFKSIFGPTWDALLLTVTREGPSGLETGKLRGPRVKKVPAHNPATDQEEWIDIWERPWTDKFEEFAKVPEFKAIQRELAEEDYLEPILSVLEDLGFESERMVAAAFSGSIHRGSSGMEGFIRRRWQSVGNDEEAVLREMARVDSNRFESFLDTLTMKRWDGWDYF